MRLMEESEAHIEEEESEEKSEDESEEESEEGSEESEEKSEEESESHIEEEESEDPLVSENIQHVAVPLVQHRQPDNQQSVYSLNIHLFNLVSCFHIYII